MLFRCNPSEGLRSVMILYDEAPIKLIEFSKNKK